ncbi:MAG: hypothetical protein E7058_02675, partial [Lentisphaerae bacterium]|nr:hypothetical protein [Lentisphaerota bacterium]
PGSCSSCPGSGCGCPGSGRGRTRILPSCTAAAAASPLPSCTAAASSSSCAAASQRQTRTPLITAGYQDEVLYRT